MPDGISRTPGAVTAAEHYDTLLAGHYTWMSGGFEEKAAEQRALLAGLGLAPARSRRAVDLGCGSGFQSVALAQLGYEVLALDTCRALLAELEEHKGELPIATQEADLRSVASVTAPGVELAICMGDTLTHLASHSEVTQLFADVRRVLAPESKFVLSYRDLSAELKGTERFIPVRSEANRIMTCFLEYEPQAVVVHDLIHIRKGERWELRKSGYRKLRLSMDWVCAGLSASGFAIKHAGTNAGLTVISAERPAS
jgi:SAM-dependent methyltransferase